MQDFLEKDLESIIIDNPKEISQRGFPKLYKNNERQFYLPSMKVVDIFSWEVDLSSDHISILIIELKRFDIGLETIMQAAGYYAEMKWMMKQLFSSITVEIVLCGRTVNNNIFDLLDLTKDVSVFKYSYGFDGINFEYAIPDEFSMEMDEDKSGRYKSFLLNKPPFDAEGRNSRSDYQKKLNQS